MRRWKALVVFAEIGFFLWLSLPGALPARLLRKVAVVVGLAKFLEQRGGKIDERMNSFAGEKGVATDAATKVVPVITVGGEKAIGGVQLMGQTDLVAKARRAVQVESDLDRGKFHFRIFIPTEKGTKDKRINGLGLSGIVDVSLKGNLKTSSSSWSGRGALKAAAIAKIVERRADELNSHINRVLSKRGKEISVPTKVVPYISVGEGSYVGAMQIAGDQSALDRVKAVLQFEKILEGGKVRARVLVPTDTIRPTQLARIKGVGATAAIDIKVEGGVGKIDKKGKRRGR